MCGSTKERILPKFDTENVVTEKLSNFYVEKINKIRENIEGNIPTTAYPSNIKHTEYSSTKMNNFEELDAEELAAILSSIKEKNQQAGSSSNYFCCSCSTSIDPFSVAFYKFVYKNG